MKLAFRITAEGLVRALAMHRHRLADHRDLNGALRQGQAREIIGRREPRGKGRADDGQRSR